MATDPPKITRRETERLLQGLAAEDEITRLLNLQEITEIPLDTPAGTPSVFEALVREQSQKGKEAARKVESRATAPRPKEADFSRSAADLGTSDTLFGALNQPTTFRAARPQAVLPREPGVAEALTGFASGLFNARQGALEAEESRRAAQVREDFEQQRIDQLKRQTDLQAGQQRNEILSDALKIAGEISPFLDNETRPQFVREYIAMRMGLIDGSITQDEAVDKIVDVAGASGALAIPGLDSTVKNLVAAYMEEARAGGTELNVSQAIGKAMSEMGKATKAQNKAAALQVRLAKLQLKNAKRTLETADFRDKQATYNTLLTSETDLRRSLLSTVGRLGAVSGDANLEAALAGMLEGGAEGLEEAQALMASKPPATNPTALALEKELQAHLNVLAELTLQRRMLGADIGIPQIGGTTDGENPPPPPREEAKAVKGGTKRESKFSGSPLGEAFEAVGEAVGTVASGVGDVPFGPAGVPLREAVKAPKRLGAVLTGQTPTRDLEVESEFIEANITEDGLPTEELVAQHPNFQPKLVQAVHDKFGGDTFLTKGYVLYHVMRQKGLDVQANQVLREIYNTPNYEFYLRNTLASGGSPMLPKAPFRR